MNSRHVLSMMLVAAVLAGCGQGTTPFAPGLGGQLNQGDTSMAMAKKEGHVKKDAVMVQLRDMKDAQAIAGELGLAIARAIAPIRLVELRAPEGAQQSGWLDGTLKKLASDRRVAMAEPCLAMKLKERRAEALKDEPIEGPNDPLKPLQYSLEAMQVPAAWKVTMGSPDVVVAVIDSGVDHKHKDLANNLVDYGYDAYHSKKGTDAATTDTMSRFGGMFASYGHGTHVAGIIAAEGNNNRGIVGVAPKCKVMPIKIFPSLMEMVRPKKNERAEDQNAIIASAVAEGIVYAAEHGADVINMSLGFPTESQSLALACDYAMKKGVTVLVAAGNERMEGSPVNTLANQPGVIGVGATDEEDRVTFFSNAGKYVSIAAPGWRVLSTMPSFFNGLIAKPYQYMDGTSMACPNAAGVAALVKSVNPKLSPAQVKQILEQSADDRGPKGYDESYGHGRLNAARAVQLAQGK